MSAAREGRPAMTYRRSGGFWSLVRAIFTARAANRSRHPASRQGARTRARRALRRWLR
jgi:hypothetical protein